MTARGRVAPVLAGLAVAAYVAAFRGYGLYDLADEGLLLAQAARAAAGEQPYTDFHTGYGPLYFAVDAALMRAGGLAALRGALVVVHGLTAALLFALARAVAGPALAAAAVALHVAFFLPLAPATGAPFNVPYPAWWAGLGGVAIALLVARDAGRGAVLVVVGALAGAVFAMKPNSGALLLAGAAVAGVTTGAPGGGGRVVAGGVGVLAVLVVVLLVAPTAASGAALVLVAPAAALAWRTRGLLVSDRTALARLAALGVGFVPVVAATVGPTIARLGSARFGQDVLHLGAGVAELYALPIGWPAVAATLLGLGALAAGTPRAAVLAGGALLAAVVLGGTVEASSLATGVRQGGERAAMAALPLVLFGGLALLVRDARLASVLAVAVLGTAQLYPRPDFDHLMPLASLVLPLALRVGREALERLGVPTERTAAAAVAIALLLAAGRFLPTGRALVAVVAGRAEAVRFPTVTLLVLPEGRARLQALADAAAQVAASTPAGERVLAFPACAAVPVLAGRLPAGPHDYFYPGRPTRQEIAALAARLRAEPPPASVTCEAPGRLAQAWESYPELVSLLEERYRIVLDRAPLTVRQRID
jgi:hypothetical protein